MAAMQVASGVEVPNNVYEAHGPVGIGAIGFDYEDSSGVQTGSTASDTSSWEAVEEGETSTVMWVPDHTSPACMKLVNIFI